MNKAIVLILRIPIAVMVAAVAFGFSKNPTFHDAIMCVAFLAFCSAIWVFSGVLNGPQETLKERLSAAKTKAVYFGLVAAIGMLVYQLLKMA